MIALYDIDADLALKRMQQFHDRRDNMQNLSRSVSSPSGGKQKLQVARVYMCHQKVSDSTQDRHTRLSGRPKQKQRKPSARLRKPNSN